MYLFFLYQWWLYTNLVSTMSVFIFIMLLTCMYSQVHIISNPLIKPLRTTWTSILLFVSMNFHVTWEVAFIVENLSAFKTFRSKFFGTLMQRSVKRRFGSDSIDKCSIASFNQQNRQEKEIILHTKILIYNLNRYL